MDYEELLKQLIDLKESGREITKMKVVFKTRKGKIRVIESLEIKNSKWCTHTQVVQLS